MFSHRLNEKTELVVFETHMADSLFILTAANIDRLRPWFSFASSSFSVQSMREYIESYLDGLKKNTEEVFAIFHEGKLAGEAGFEWIDEEQKASSLMYWIGEEFEGNGIVTLACVFLINRAFNLYGVEKVNIFAAANNVRSRKVAERLGFKLDGILRSAWFINERLLDKAAYSVLKEEWKKSNYFAPNVI